MLNFEKNSIKHNLIDTFLKLTKFDHLKLYAIHVYKKHFKLLWNNCKLQKMLLGIQGHKVVTKPVYHCIFDKYTTNKTLKE